MCELCVCTKAERSSNCSLMNLLPWLECHALLIPRKVVCLIVCLWCVCKWLCKIIYYQYNKHMFHRKELYCLRAYPTQALKTNAANVRRHVRGCVCGQDRRGSHPTLSPKNSHACVCCVCGVRLEEERERGHVVAFGWTCRCSDARKRSSSLQPVYKNSDIRNGFGNI